MPGRPTLFRALVQKRQWENWSVFACHAERAARDLAMKADEPRLLGVLVARRSFDRWMLGELNALPQRDHQVVLEHLLGYPCATLFGLPSGTVAPDREVTGRDWRCPDWWGWEYASPVYRLAPGEQAGGA